MTMDQWAPGTLGPAGQAAVERVGAALGANIQQGGVNGLIHPVVDLSPYLKQLRGESVNELDPGGVTDVEVARPPVGEIWRVMGAYCRRGAVGTGTLAFYAIRSTDTAAQTVRLTDPASAATQLFVPAGELWVDQDHYLVINVDGYTANDTFDIAAYVERLACLTPVVAT